MRKTALFFAFLLCMVTALGFPGLSIAQSNQSEIKLKADEQKRLNTFFSNFSEVFMESFRQDSLSEKELIRFGVAHNYHNRPKLFEKLQGGIKARIREEHVSASALKYFGKNISKHQSGGEYEYRDGYYYVVEASGEAIQFSQVARVFDLGNNRFSVDVNVYLANSGWRGNVHATPSTWKKSADDAPELSKTMKATIRKTGADGGKSPYILIEYIENQQIKKDMK